MRQFFSLLLLYAVYVGGVIVWMEWRHAPSVAQHTTPVQSPYHVGDVISLWATEEATSGTLVTASSTGELMLYKALADYTRICFEGFGCSTVGELRKAVK